MHTPKNLATVLLGLLLGLASTTANATVVYHWTTISPSPYFEPLNGTLEISDAAWRAGSLDYDFSHSISDPADGGDPDSPISAALFTISSPFIAVSPIDINIYPRTMWGDWTLRANLGFDRSTGLLHGKPVRQQLGKRLQHGFR